MVRSRIDRINATPGYEDGTVTVLCTSSDLGAWGKASGYVTIQSETFVTWCLKHLKATYLYHWTTDKQRKSVIIGVMYTQTGNSSNTAAAQGLYTTTQLGRLV